MEIEALTRKTIDGKFEILDVLGQGGMGVVYRCRQLSMGREVAVKLLHPDVTDDADAVKRFLREAQAASRLSHPNVITVFDFGQTAEGDLYLVMELLEGRELLAELRSVKRMSPARAIHIVAQICDAVHHAHEADLVHRDLKPENVFLIDGGWHNRDFVKVLDFGVAKLQTVEGAERITRTGAVCGTPAYISPEQILGESTDRRADIYSIGVMLFELLTGRLPFLDEQPMKQLLAHLSEKPPRFAEACPDLEVTAELEALVRACLSKNPAQRPRTALRLAERLVAAHQGHELGDDPSDSQVVLAVPSAEDGSRATASYVLDSAQMTGVAPAGRSATVTPGSNPTLTPGRTPTMTPGGTPTFVGDQPQLSGTSETAERSTRRGGLDSTQVGVVALSPEEADEFELSASVFGMEPLALSESSGSVPIIDTTAGRKRATTTAPGADAPPTTPSSGSPEASSDSASVRSGSTVVASAVEPASRETQRAPVDTSENATRVVAPVTATVPAPTSRPDEGRRTTAHSRVTHLAMRPARRAWAPLVALGVAAVLVVLAAVVLLGRQLDRDSTDNSETSAPVAAGQTPSGERQGVASESGAVPGEPALGEANPPTASQQGASQQAASQQGVPALGAITSRPPFRSAEESAVRQVRLGPVANAKAPRSARIAVQTQPADADLFVDGARLATDERSFLRPQDGTTRRLEVRRRGYWPQTLVVSEQAEASLTVRLRKRRKKPGPATGPGIIR